MRLSDFPDLGIGVGLRPDHYEHFLNGRHPASVAWVEVITENYLPWERGTLGRPFQNLEKIRRELPVALHGVSLSIGSADPLNESYLKRLEDLVARVQPAWISDHLCWTAIRGENTHDLMPLPYTREALDLIVPKIARVQDRLRRRILIENVSSYVEFECSEMSEPVFLAELAKRADCGILLDVNNIYVSSVNHGFDPIEYLKTLPADRVGQIHLAGHSDQGDYLIDTHDAPVCDEVWDLYRWVARNLAPTSAMIERDAEIPEWRELELELEVARGIREGERQAVHETRRAAVSL